MKTNIQFWSYLAEFLEWEMFQEKNFREDQNWHFILDNFFPPRKSCLLLDNVEKYCAAVLATGDNMARAHCMLGN